MQCAPGWGPLPADGALPARHHRRAGHVDHYNVAQGADHLALWRSLSVTGRVASLSHRCLRAQRDFVAGFGVPETVRVTTAGAGYSVGAAVLHRNKVHLALSATITRVTAGGGAGEVEVTWGSQCKAGDTATLEQPGGAGGAVVVTAATPARGRGPKHTYTAGDPVTPASLPPGFRVGGDGTKIRSRTVVRPCVVCESAGDTGPGHEVVVTEVFTWALARAGRVAISVGRCSRGHAVLAAPAPANRAAAATPEERKAIRQLVLQQHLSPAAAFSEGQRQHGTFPAPAAIRAIARGQKRAGRCGALQFLALPRPQQHAHGPAQTHTHTHTHARM